MDGFFKNIFSRQPARIENGVHYFGIDGSYNYNGCEHFGDRFDEPGRLDEFFNKTQETLKLIWNGEKHDRPEIFDLCDGITTEIAEEGRPFLDIASGVKMGLAPFILRKNPKVPCLVSDISENMMKACRLYAVSHLQNHNIGFARLDAEDIPIGDGSLDCVTGAFALTNISNNRKTVNEVYRILKPGGFFITVENDWDWPEVDKLYKLWEEERTLHEYDYNWHEKFGSAGFTVEKSGFYSRRVTEDDDMGRAAEKHGVDLICKRTLFILKK